MKIYLISYYQKLSSIRAKYRDIFAVGAWKEVLSENDLMIFKRELDDKSLYVYVNNSENERSFKKDGKRFHELFSNQIYENGIKISAYCFGIAEETSIHF